MNLFKNSLVLSQELQLVCVWFPISKSSQTLKYFKIPKELNENMFLCMLGCQAEPQFGEQKQ